LIDVATFLARHRLEGEVVHHEQVDRDELGHEAVAGVVETALPQLAQ
jgi:hypothetical protein